jgi:gamma-glutamylcyclotransferase (GGCT)/AIG2-like uncharacterized protein YtfP
MDVFTYGSLQFPSVIGAVVGRVPARVPAVLEGFARFRVRGASYPGIVARAGARTAGTLWRGLDLDALAALDRFEGALYERRRLPVRTRAGATVVAHVYVVRDARRDVLGPEPWDEARFEREHLARFLSYALPDASRSGRSGSR